jgi:hypothetical protein
MSFFLYLGLAFLLIGIGITAAAVLRKRDRKLRASRPAA